MVETFLLRELLCFKFVLLHVAHSASSSVRFCLLLDYIKLALFLFLFLSDFHGYFRGWR